ncbi:uncharacterized protein N7483_002401 [Penicillium malachiteum]|uniref:uncharacterized protein n=1 Tax=Penicillium malachiteum TaxID=1324776 RepID=UPI002549B394|nr:uncharacterized protein N7483_002401 [Penicillium malachiteum]KAJ5737276.1 hypothetical protein N7483_002401 [Penicillium malachiteum]
MEYIWNENDFDLDFHQIWKESDLPAPPPCLATKFDETKPENSHAEKTMAHRAQDPIVECLFYSNTKSNHAFRWMGPSPLLLSTKPEDIFVYISAFLSEKIGWLEVRLAQLDLFTRGVVDEHLFFIPRIETASWKFQHTRQEILNIVSYAVCVMPGCHFRLSVWPRLEPFPYSASSTLSPLAALPTMPSLYPSDFVHNP